jgi:lipopolysaccharide/colanic/teichoic acid biosynthesis glycosyltransferase
MKQRANRFDLCVYMVPYAGTIRAVTADPCGVVAMVDVGAAEADPDLSPYVRSWRKRLLDLVVGVPLALLVIPVVVGLALVMLVSLRTWPFFVQRRVGRGGRLFRIVKLRTLPRSAPRHADKTVIAAVLTTRAGRYLRGTHLDELPQIFLVVSGRMSLVGPRPEMPQLMGNFDPVEARLRTTVRPGCTGVWQVSGDAGRQIYEVPQYDRAYLVHARASLDLFLLWSTLRCMLHSTCARPRRARFRVVFGLDA